MYRLIKGDTFHIAYQKYPNDFYLLPIIQSELAIFTIEKERELIK